MAWLVWCKSAPQGRGAVGCAAMESLPPGNPAQHASVAQAGPTRPRRRTLWILLVVLVACGVWAAVAAWQRRPSKVARTQSWLRLLRSGVLLFEAERGRLPTQQEGLDVLLNPPPAPGAQTAQYVLDLWPDPWGRP
jgi:hypothetical protein